MPTAPIVFDAAETLIPPIAMLSSFDVAVEILERPGRGRGVFAAKDLAVGTIVSCAGGSAFAACVLPSLHESRCASCFASLTGGRRVKIVRCQKCKYACYCSTACVQADSSQHSRQCSYIAQTSSPLRRLELRGADEQRAVLGRFGAACLVSRCLWQRHDQPVAAPTAATKKGAATDSGADAACFDTMAPGPTSESDLEIGRLCESLHGFLPPGATAANVVAVLGSFRTNEFRCGLPAARSKPPRSRLLLVQAASCSPPAVHVVHLCFAGNCADRSAGCSLLCVHALSTLCLLTPIQYAFHRNAYATLCALLITCIPPPCPSCARAFLTMTLSSFLKIPHCTH